MHSGDLQNKNKKSPFQTKNILEAAQLKERSPSEIHVYSICTETVMSFYPKSLGHKQSPPQNVKQSTPTLHNIQTSRVPAA